MTEIYQRGAIYGVPSATLDKNNLVNARHITCAVPKKLKQQQQQQKTRFHTNIGRS